MGDPKVLGGEGGGSQSCGVREETMELWGWEWGTLKLWGMGDPRAMGVGNGVRRDLKCWGDGMG